MSECNGAFASLVRVTAVDLNEPIETRDDYLADYLASAILDELGTQADSHGAKLENDGAILSMNGTFDLSGIVKAVLDELKSVADQVKG